MSFAHRSIDLPLISLCLKVLYHKTAVEMKMYYMDSGKGLRGAAGREAGTLDPPSAAPLLLIVSV